jgi:FAR-17a/AIG1-like protein
MAAFKSKAFLHLDTLLSIIKNVMFSTAIFKIELISNVFASESKKEQFGIRESLYLTNLSLFYMIFTVVAGAVHRMSKRMKSYYLFALSTAVVLEAIVVVQFWGLYLKDPRLVKPKSCFENGQRLSAIDELPKHLFPLLILILEKRAIRIKKSMSHRLFLLTVTIVYFSILKIYNIVTDDYLYPFLELLSYPKTFMFHLFSLLICFGFYECWMFLAQLY